MPDQRFHGLRILIVEDEYLLADDLRETLEDAGATVLGPAASVEEATALVQQEHDIDIALLDINLRGEMIFPVADLLRGRDVRFAFTTGYDQWAVPERFIDAPRIEKPVKPHKVASMLQTLIAAEG